LKVGVTLAAERVGTAYRSQATWLEGVRAGLLALLELIDEVPTLARLCVARAIGGGLATLARHDELLTDLAKIIDEGRISARSNERPPPRTAEGVIGGSLGLIYARLLAAEERPLVELANPVMGMIVRPYLGEAAATRELHRPAPAASGAAKLTRERGG
jgi:hypothetical protein